LRVASARLATRPGWALRELVTALEQEQGRLSALTLESDEAMTVRGPLTLSYRALSPGPARLYRLLGVFPGTDFDSRVAAALTGLPWVEARRQLAVLADVNLLADLSQGRHRFHELTRLHAREVALADEPPESRTAALHRMLDWYLYAVAAAGRVAAPYRRALVPEPVGEALEWTDPAAALDWLDQEFRNLVAVARWALAESLPHQVYELVDAAWPLFLHRGHLIERLGFDRLGLTAARQAYDRTAEAKMLNRTGLALQALGRYDEAAADFSAALLLWRELGVKHRVAGTLRRLGLVDLARGDLDAALERFRTAAERYAVLGEDRRQAKALRDVAEALVGADRSEEAVAPLREALVALSLDDDPHTRARVLMLLGKVGVDPGPVHEALATMRTLGSHSGEAAALRVLADLAAQAGDAVAAERYEAEYREVRDRITGAG
jgi:tetratricopeptide (TPR) repeat protein